VTEGLFIEYKRELSNSKVARAVASFASSESGGMVVIVEVWRGVFVVSHCLPKRAFDLLRGASRSGEACRPLPLFLSVACPTRVHLAPPYSLAA
jgi:hypothetical protein